MAHEHCTGGLMGKILAGISAGAVLLGTVMTAAADTWILWYQSGVIYKNGVCWLYCDQQFTPLEDFQNKQQCVTRLDKIVADARKVLTEPGSSVKRIGQAGTGRSGLTTVEPDGIETSRRWECWPAGLTPK